MAEVEYKQDGPEALRIASVIPYYPFHGEYILLFHSNIIILFVYDYTQQHVIWGIVIQSTRNSTFL